MKFILIFSGVFLIYLLGLGFLGLSIYSYYYLINNDEYDPAFKEYQVNSTDYISTIFGAIYQKPLNEEQQKVIDFYHGKYYDIYTSEIGYLIPYYYEMFKGEEIYYRYFPIFDKNLTKLYCKDDLISTLNDIPLYRASINYPYFNGPGPNVLFYFFCFITLILSVIWTGCCVKFAIYLIKSFDKNFSNDQLVTNDGLATDNNQV